MASFAPIARAAVAEIPLRGNASPTPAMSELFRKFLRDVVGFIFEGRGERGSLNFHLFFARRNSHSITTMPSPATPGGFRLASPGTLRRNAGRLTSHRPETTPLRVSLTPMKTPGSSLLGCGFAVARISILCGALSAAFLGHELHAQPPAGAISGVVSNAGTGDLLEGVRVSLPGLGLTTLTDNTGRYTFTQVPAGTHAILATYTGLDSLQQVVTVTPAQYATRDFELSTGVYKLEAFTVAGEREGGAAAITAQRNAPNTKNVVAMDSYGNLPNMSASELAILLPGVTAALNLENGIDGFTVRGLRRGVRRAHPLE
jgi:hypothetical protein